MTLTNSSITTLFSKYWILIAVLVLIIIAIVAYRKGKNRNAVNSDVYNYTPNRTYVIQN